MALSALQQLPPEPTVFENQVTALASLDASGAAGPITHLIVGPPGSGKSATALHWANRQLDRFSDGRLYLDLRGHDPERALRPREALAVLLTSLRIDPAVLPDETSRRAALWRSTTFDLNLLVLLDNAADPEQIEDLLCTGPRTVTVVTSRNVLTDLTFRPGVRTTPINLLSPEQSRALLRRLIEPRRGPVAQRDLADLAHLCGYLQLALRVAAQRLAKSPLLSVAEFCDELRDRARILDPVRAVFDSSYHGLRPASARTFRLFGLAPGSDLSLEAIIALIGAEPREVREQLEELLNDHLLSPGRPGRYLMHDLLHAYAAELATAPDFREDADAALARLGRWYAHAAASAAQALGSEVDVLSTVHAAQDPHWFGGEESNLAIMVDALSSRGLDQEALELCANTVELFAFYGASAWIKVAHTGLALARKVSDPGRQAWFLESLGKIHLQAGELPQSLAAHQAALELRRNAGDGPGQARSLNAIGLVHWRAASYDQAESHLSRSRELAVRHGDASFETFAIMNLALVAVSRARAAQTTERSPLFETALSLLNVALARLGPTQRFYRAHALCDRAEALAGLGNIDAAHADAVQAVLLARQSASPLVLATALRAAAQVKILQGQIPDAQRDLLEALEVTRDLADPAKTQEIYERLESTGYKPSPQARQSENRDANT